MSGDRAKMPFRSWLHALTQRVSRLKREERLHLTLQYMADLPKPVNIIDLGGTEQYWRNVGYASAEDVRVLLVNIEPPEQPPVLENFKSLVADATALGFLQDRSFDFVFSNSVIEHCGDESKQRAFAGEVQRLGKRYVIQTPSFWFPFEPHFQFPFYHWLPLPVRALLIRSFKLGFFNRRRCWSEAFEAAGSIRLLTAGQLKKLFPKAAIHRERFLFLTKSFIVVGE